VNPDNNIWQKALGVIKKELNSQSFDTWFGPTTLVTTSSNSITVAVPNKFFKEWLIEHYHPLIKRTLEVISGEKISVKFVSWVID